MAATFRPESAVETRCARERFAGRETGQKRLVVFDADILNNTACKRCRCLLGPEFYNSHQTNKGARFPL